jgi:hypothetical protein
MIRFACQCGKQLQAKDAYAGKRVQCPACGRAPLVPNPAAVGPVETHWQIESSSAVAERAEQAGVVPRGTATVVQLRTAGPMQGDVAVEGILGCWYCRTEQPFAGHLFRRVGIGGSLVTALCVKCRARVWIGFSTHPAGKGADIYLYAPSQTRNWVEASAGDAPPVPVLRVQQARDVAAGNPPGEDSWVNNLLPALAQAVSQKEPYQKVSELAARLVGLRTSGPQMRGVRLALRALLSKEQSTYLCTILAESLACLRDTRAAPTVRDALQRALNTEDPGDRTNLPLHELCVLALLFGDRRGFLEAVQRGMRQLPMITRACKLGKRLPLKELIALVERRTQIDSYDGTLGGAHWQYVQPLLSFAPDDVEPRKDEARKSWLDRFLK